jgi:hypothetical protein
MSDTSDEKEKKQKPVVLPIQQSSIDVSNQENKVSTDPNGEKYIRTTDED